MLPVKDLWSSHLSAFRLRKGYFPAVIYLQEAAFVSIRSDIGHCFHIWCIRAFPCPSEISLHIQFSPILCPIFPNIQMITAWCFLSLLSRLFFFFPLFLSLFFPWFSPPWKVTYFTDTWFLYSKSKPYIYLVQMILFSNLPSLTDNWSCFRFSAWELNYPPHWIW